MGSVFDFLILIDNRTVGVDHSIAIFRAGIFNKGKFDIVTAA